MADIKSSTSFSEQVIILKKRGLIIPDDNVCEEYLKQVNYYRFSAYLLPFKDKQTETLKNGTTFGKICAIYGFDERLRCLLLSEIEKIEIFLRTQISNYFSQKYGPLGHLEESNFNSKKINWKEYTSHLENSILAHNQTLVVQHHLKKYDGKIPIWVSIEYFTLGSLSFFIMI